MEGIAVGLIRNILGGIVEMVFNVAVEVNESGAAQRSYDNLSKQEEKLKRMKPSNERNQQLEAIQARKEMIRSGMESYDKNYRNNPEGFDKADEFIDRIKGR